MKKTMTKNPEGYSLLLEYPTQYVYTEFFAYQPKQGHKKWALKVLHYDDSIMKSRQVAINGSHATFFADTVAEIKAHVKTCMESIEAAFEGE